MGVLFDSDAEGTVEHSSVAGTDPGQTCGGHNIVAVRSAHLAVDGFESSRAGVCGVFVAHDGDLFLSHGVVSHNEIGACVFVPGYPLSRLTNHVAYRNNNVTIEGSGGFPVPPEVPPLP